MNLEKLQAALSKFKTYHSNFPRVTIDKSWNCFSNSNTCFWLQVKQIFWDLFTTASFFFRGEAYYSTWNEVVFTSCWRWGKSFKAGPHIVFEGEIQAVLHCNRFSHIYSHQLFEVPPSEADMKFSEISAKLSLLPSRNIQGGINILKSKQLWIDDLLENQKKPFNWASIFFQQSNNVRFSTTIAFHVFTLTNSRNNQPQDTSRSKIKKKLEF